MTTTAKGIPQPALDSAEDSVPPVPHRLKRSTPALVLVGVAVIVFALSMALPFGRLDSPGPGLWPLTVSGILIAAATITILLDDSSGQERWGRGTAKIAVATGSLATFIMLFELIGFTLPAMAMTLVWLKAFGQERWKTSCLIAVIAPVLLYLLFGQILGVSLPWDALMSLFMGA